MGDYFAVDFRFWPLAEVPIVLGRVCFQRKSGHQIGRRIFETNADTLSLVGGFEGRGGQVENISGKPMVLGGRPFRPFLS